MTNKEYTIKVTEIINKLLDDKTNLSYGDKVLLLKLFSTIIMEVLEWKDNQNKE